jgi:ubiquinone/menaquinone biosynthesis C-methylase UbiE
MLKKGGALICTDISDQMITKLHDRFKKSEFGLVPGNKTMIKAEELGSSEDRSIEVPKISAGERLVIAGVANNEALPFKEGQFDCYLANLSLMLVDNYKNMLAEALRVTQSGATFGFTVYGREGNF